MTTNRFKKETRSLYSKGAMGQLGLTYLVWDQMTPVQNLLCERRFIKKPKNAKRLKVRVAPLTLLRKNVAGEATSLSSKLRASLKSYL